MILEGSSCIAATAFLYRLLSFVPEVMKTTPEKPGKICENSMKKMDIKMVFVVN